MENSQNSDILMFFFCFFFYVSSLFSALTSPNKYPLFPELCPFASSQRRGYPAMFGSNHSGPCTQNSLAMHGTHECPILTPFCPCCDTPAPPLHAAFAYSNWLPEDMARGDRKWGGDRKNQVWEKWKTGKVREKGEAGAGDRWYLI